MQLNHFYFLLTDFWGFDMFGVASRMVSFGMEDFAKKYGALKPYQFVDVISLVGDKCDNIPGFIAIF